MFCPRHIHRWCSAQTRMTYLVQSQLQPKLLRAYQELQLQLRRIVGLMDFSSLAWHNLFFLLAWERMRTEHKAMRAPADCELVVIFRNQSIDGVRQFSCECSAIRCRAKPNHRVDRQGCQVLLRLAGAAYQGADFPYDSCGQCNEVPGRKTIPHPGGIGREPANRRR